MHTRRKLRRFLAAFFAILLAVGWHEQGVCESPILYVMVGQTPVGVRNPAGFVDPRIVNPQFGALFKDVSTPSHQSLVVLIPHQDVRRMMAGAKPDLDRVLRIDVHRDSAVSTTSLADFKLLKGSLHAMLTSKNPANEVIFDETERSISRIEVRPRVVISTSIVHVREKVIRVGVESTLEDGKNEDWVKSMTREFIGLILDANKPSTSRP